MTAVPNLVGLTLSQVQNTLESKHLNLRIEGTDSTGSSVVAATQDIAEGTEVALGNRHHRHVPRHIRHGLKGDRYEADRTV